MIKLHKIKDYKIMINEEEYTFEKVKGCQYYALFNDFGTIFKELTTTIVADLVNEKINSFYYENYKITYSHKKGEVIYLVREILN